MTASPEATARMPARRSSGGGALRRKPLAPAGSGAGGDGAVVEGGAFSHAGESVSFVVARCGSGAGRAGAGVVALDVHAGVLDVHRQLDAGVVAGVLEGVGEGLLHDAVHGEL